jgi:hypothetical protein
MIRTFAAALAALVLVSFGTYAQTDTGAAKTETKSDSADAGAKKSSSSSSKHKKSSSKKSSSSSSKKSSSSTSSTTGSTGTTEQPKTETAPK